VILVRQNPQVTVLRTLVALSVLAPRAYQAMRLDDVGDVALGSP
jgi:hypothetical protein